METNKDVGNTIKKTSYTNYTIILTTIIIGVMLLSSSSVVFFPPQEAEAKIADKKEIRIASWNLLNIPIDVRPMSVMFCTRVEKLSRLKQKRERLCWNFKSLIKPVRS